MLDVGAPMIGYKPTPNLRAWLDVHCLEITEPMIMHTLKSTQHDLTMWMGVRPDVLAQYHLKHDGMWLIDIETGSLLPVLTCLSSALCRHDDWARTYHSRPFDDRDRISCAKCPIKHCSGGACYDTSDTTPAGELAPYFEAIQHNNVEPMVRLLESTILKLNEVFNNEP